MKLRAFGLGLALSAAVLSTGCGGESPTATTATIAIRHSHFTLTSVSVPSGQPVTFTLRNDDPIEHEWIVGAAEVHSRHRTGSEPSHDAVPTEVTIPAFTAKTTTITFDRPSDYVFIYHLPNHEKYGMQGVMHVVTS